MIRTIVAIALCSAVGAASGATTATETRAAESGDEPLAIARAELKLAETLFSSAQNDEALAIAATAMSRLDDCVANYPEHGGCRFERGLQARSGGRFGAALDDLKVAYRLAPDAQTATLLAELFRISGAYAESRELVNAALTDYPGSVPLLWARARHQLRDRQDADAEQSLRAVLELAPRHDRAQRLLGGLLMRSGDPVEAAYLLAAADRNRDYHASYRLLTRAFETRRETHVALLAAELDLTVGDYDRAQRWLTLARSDSPPSARWASAQAWTLYALGKIAAGDAILAASVGASDGHMELARAARAVRVGEPQEAQRRVAAAVRRGPNERSFLRRAADLYNAAGLPDEAERLLIRAASAQLP